MKIQKINKKYSHPTKLNQAFYFLIFYFYQVDNQIRSTQIQVFLLTCYKIEVSKRWINKILYYFEVTRPLGRPKKTYNFFSSYNYDYCYETNSEKQYIEQIGMKLILNLTNSFKLPEIYIDSILESIKNNDKTIIPKNDKSLLHFINTLTCIVLDQRVHNFEEAKRSELPFKEMDVERCRQILKEFDNIPDIIFKLTMNSADYWIDNLGLLENGKDINIYIDGHSTPYYTKKKFVKGYISNSSKIVPGTHNSICCIEGGYVLFLSVDQVNTHLNNGLVQLCVYLKDKLGELVSLIIVDRECNGKDFNKNIKEHFNISILSLLNSSQYESIDDFYYYWIRKNEFALGLWKDWTKRINDPRTFLLYKKNDKLIVFCTTSDHYKHLLNGVEYYSSRWIYNENIIKLLKHDFDFDVNVGNGSSVIPNPKIPKLEREYSEKINRCKENICKSESNRLNNIFSDKKASKYEKQKLKQQDYYDKLQKDYTEERYKLSDEVYIRHLNAQSFMNILKTNLFNFILYLLSLVYKTKEPLKYGVERLLDLLINRSGYITKDNHKIEFLFNKPVYKKDQEYLSSFLNGISKLKLKDEDGRLIIAKVYPEDG